MTIVAQLSVERVWQQEGRGNGGGILRTERNRSCVPIPTPYLLLHKATAALPSAQNQFNTMKT
uniref:Uncharacterized protein n=1 Tax=Heterorhabditis bacteriophora TaxID=37862 RepID=A0A1I7XEB4_HETBA